MALARSFRDLHVYQKARQQASIIFQITGSFPKSETYSLIDQIRRSSRAVNAILTEGWSRRHYEKVFWSKLSEAVAEARETQCWLDFALDCQYITEIQHSELNDNWEHVSAMLQKMMDRASDFCQVYNEPI